MSSTGISRPDVSEHNSYYIQYIQLVPGEDILAALERQAGDTPPFLRQISEQQSLIRYSPGKWTIKEVLAHMADTERIMTYRALRFARNDRTPLPGFEQDDYIRSSDFNAVPWSHLSSEFESVRAATLSFFRALPREAWQRRGIANDYEVTVRALAYIIAGHELHHLGIVRTRYLAK